MAIISLTDALTLNETTEYPDGYNAVIVEGRGDELKRDRFPRLSISGPSEMVSDGEAWYTVVLSIREYAVPSNVLVKEHWEQVSAEYDDHVSVGNHIEEFLEAGYWGTGSSPDDFTYLGGSDTLTQYFHSITEGNTIWFANLPGDGALEWVSLLVKYTGNVEAQFSEGYPSDLPPWEQPPDDETLVGLTFNPEHASVMVDGSVSGGGYGQATCSVLMQPTPGEYGYSVVSGTYRGATVYLKIPVIRGGWDGASITLEADPSSVSPGGSTETDPETGEVTNTDESLLTAECTDYDGTPFPDGTDIDWMVYIGSGSLAKGSTKTKTLTNITEQQDSGSVDSISTDRPIRRVHSIRALGPANWTWNPDASDISGNTITFGVDPVTGVDNTLPLQALPLEIKYDAGGIATNTYYASRNAEIGEEITITAIIPGTKLNALATITIVEPNNDGVGDNGETMNIEFDTNNLDQWVEGGGGVYVSNIIAYVSNSEGMIPSRNTHGTGAKTIKLAIIDGGRSGRLYHGSVTMSNTMKVGDTANYTEWEETTVQRDDETGKYYVTVKYPLHGYADPDRAEGGSLSGQQIVVRKKANGQTLPLGDTPEGNRIYLANSQPNGSAVYVKYTAGYLAFAKYELPNDLIGSPSVEEFVDIKAAWAIDPDVMALNQIQVGDPYNDEWEMDVAAEPDDTIATVNSHNLEGPLGTSSFFRRITVAVTDTSLDPEALVEGARLKFEITSGEGVLQRPSPRTYDSEGYAYPPIGGTAVWVDQASFDVITGSGGVNAEKSGFQTSIFAAPVPSAGFQINDSEFNVKITLFGTVGNVPDTEIASQDVTINITSDGGGGGGGGSGRKVEMELAGGETSVNPGRGTASALNGFEFSLEGDIANSDSIGDYAYTDNPPTASSFLVAKTILPATHSYRKSSLFARSATLGNVASLSLTGRALTMRFRYPYKKNNPDITGTVTQSDTASVIPIQNGVYASTNHPVADAQVSLYSEGALVASTRTDATGRFIFKKADLPQALSQGGAEYNVVVNAEGFKLNVDPASFGVTLPYTKESDIDQRNDAWQVAQISPRQYVISPLDIDISVRGEVTLKPGQGAPS